MCVRQMPFSVIFLLNKITAPTFINTLHSKKDPRSLGQPRTFNIERITIFIFSFCIGLVTQLNGPALGVLKHHYITKRIRELLIGNSRFLIHNLLNQLLYYAV